MARQGKEFKFTGMVAEKKNSQKNIKKTDLGITKPAIRRLARRGGVMKNSSLIYEETRNALRSFLDNLLSNSVNYTENAVRKTMSTFDVE